MYKSGPQRLHVVGETAPLPTIREHKGTKQDPQIHTGATLDKGTIGAGYQALLVLTLPPTGRGHIAQGKWGTFKVGRQMQRREAAQKLSFFRHIAQKVRGDKRETEEKSAQRYKRVRRSAAY